ncbi:chromosome segregation protein SMC [Clostridium aestuarii]|uniref:Chromosome partition protein Smc n=1 Tax=Clostridium aestuarii TaxID=338193 RepID=A0ABT4CYC4_9CLOT|nr:chromosome segregation protein SMC [Clostridium aestuarii]MCY6483976.1 chromosome segregation protein SMC [Clostridium aestuarii]
MFLKSLEIRGFKSFADKTEMVFKKGITAVVGPNGSGKSNISDAVKWVLGEQSVKNLRGGRMQDVIFAGTEFRRPVGLAQVTLVLDNSDRELPIEYIDVTITRRLFKSGESEYYLNNTKCRLKDIQELFMDTGIGKEGYSIIGQGKIEAVLSGRPEERRSILEEAVGIVKFKSRKEEAQKKLYNTEQNLQRINDIFSTYEERLEPLRKENEKAKEFLELSQKLKVKEVTVIIDSINNIENKINFFKSEVQNNEINLKELLNEKNKYKDELMKYNNELEKMEMENSEERKKYYDSKTSKQNLLSQIDLLNEKISNLSNSNERASKTLTQLNIKIEELKEQKISEKIKLESIKNQEDSFKKNILKNEEIMKRSSNEIEGNNTLIKNSKSYQSDLLSNITKYKNNLVLIKNEINTQQNKLDEYKNNSETYGNSIKINHSTRNVLNNEIINIKKNINNYENHIREYKKAISMQNKNLVDEEKKLQAITSIYNKAEAKCNAFMNLEKQYEGYNRSVKNLMTHIEKHKIPDVLDNTWVLGEIIKVEKNLEVAIEIALGGSISNIITLNENIAKKLIKYLKDNKLGRATFLPISIIKGKKTHISDKIKRMKGYIGIASEIVSHNSKFINAIDYVLGRTVIAEDMNSALSIAKESGYSFKIVTLTGEVVNPGGALTGGSLHNRNVSIISRKREIDEITLNLKEYSIQIKDSIKKIDVCKVKIKKMDDEILNLRDKVHFQNIESTKINGKISAIDNENDKLKRDLKIANNEMILAKENIDNNILEMKKNEYKIEDLTKLQNENSNKIFETENILDKQNQQLKDKNEEITSLKIKKAQVEESILNVIKDIRRIDDEIIEMKNQVIDIENEIKKADINKSILSEKIIENHKKIDQILKDIKEYEEKFKEAEINRIKIKENIKNHTENLEKVTLLYNKKEKENHNIEIALARGDTEKNSLYKKINEEMELTYAEAVDLKLKDGNIKKCKEDIIYYKGKISKIGVVNLGAIEEYNELIKKHDFMKSQKEDLIKGKEELLSVVSEMTSKMKKVFHENFNKLRKNFNETFIELFKGGNADLILEGEDELTSNIEINVQPPGKKLSNINLMSGGEKGLSAIALLFAILKMKPTPFCILDEIEAALDDSNVVRYAQFLNKFSHSTQFIIITHRKGSMEASDVLYGVTMEEKGISKIISVDLSN